MALLIPVAVAARAPSALAALAAQDSPVLWYLTRTTAVAAYVALTLSVALGMLRTIARTSGESLTWVVDELHAVVATLAAGLVVGHLISLRLDTFIPFTTANLLIPGDQPYRPLAVNLGVFALYTLAIFLFSSWLRRRLPYRFWRTLHVLSFLAFALISLHGLLAGSDASEPWMRGVYGMAIGAVGFLTVMRLVGGRRRAVAVAEET
jgi:methionine sulfoxide reductase heme-binding subunit